MPEAEAQAIAAAFRRAGWLAVSTPTSVNWRLPVAGRIFDEYWDARPGHLRATASRRADRAPIDIAIHDRFHDGAWADYAQVYGESWKPEEGSPDFLRGFAEAEGAAGTLRLGIASLDGRPIAAQLWTVENGVAIIHKLAYSADAKEYSPGTQLSAAMFRHAIDTDGVQTIDFGTGDDRYKADWMEDRHPLYGIALYNLRRPSAWPGAARAWMSALVRRGRVD